MTDLERHIFARMFEYEREHKKRAEYLICDLDTRFEIMETLKDVQIKNDGRYIIFGLKICIIDGLTKKQVLEVR